jgi:hypothetical protein
MTPEARRAAAFDLGIVFRIDPALLKHIPERAACTPLAVAKVHKFLTDEWLVDVAAAFGVRAAVAVRGESRGPSFVFSPSLMHLSHKRSPHERPCKENNLARDRA